MSLSCRSSENFDKAREDAIRLRSAKAAFSDFTFHLESYEADALKPAQDENRTVGLFNLKEKKRTFLSTM